ncbi:thiosulfate reductase [Desulfosarcina alkanivorans]|uniref:Thiosulfate reductase n=1 Tax=Desulfosarcina alkanivorans TaxID=571177 RepID=A0A5K7YUB6_9BACT|nr:molybdopterin-dependent oxidoreductase [Desulfosarcina alkanivorans]BBO72238.1 thiosulfate reductase [Desulfosarcina alkanivorans]
MTTSKAFSICGMCTARCPIQVDSENGTVKRIRGNPHVPAMTGVCPRGVAGTALIEDSERPQTPLIRTGERGEGKWREASWDEALDYVAGRLTKIKEKYGARGIAFSDRGGPFRDHHRAFLRGIGTPNYCNHDSSCARNIQHAAISLTGMGRKAVAYDLKHARHVVLQFRNIFEAVNIQEVSNLMHAMDNGCKLTVIDVRANISATKATRYLQIRPGTDYAFNLAVIHELIARRLYNEAFVQAHVAGMNKLEQFVKPYTPEWAEQETGIPATQLRAFVKELAEASPAVIWHPGWMAARYKDSFYICRSIYTINALLGAYGAKGGLPFVSKPGDVGKKGLKSFMDLYPKPEEKRADGVGWRYPQFETGPGLLHLMFEAMETADPYPVKGYIAYRHDPLMGYPDQERIKELWSNLDLLVSITFSWSDTAWNADVVLPLSPYLERDDVIATKNALKPQFFVRQRAVAPRYNTRADWEIFGGLARRMGLPDLAFDSVEDLWNFQLEGTGVSIGDFNATGMVPLADAPIYKDMETFKFKTPSGKIELVSDRLESNGLPSLKPYESPQSPPEGQFRLTFGRCILHTQGHTVNNPALFDKMPENLLWINRKKAEGIGVDDGDTVRVSQNGHWETIRAKVTDMIHPEAIFVIHGFGHQLAAESRAFGKGLADNNFMSGGLTVWDQAGGAVAYQEHFVKVEKA